MPNQGLFGRICINARGGVIGKGKRREWKRKKGEGREGKRRKKMKEEKFLKKYVNSKSL